MDEHPPPGSPAELARFAELQEQLRAQFRSVFADPAAPRTVIVVPSLTIDQQVLQEIPGAPYYEERLLCLLMLLRLPRTKVVYLTSNPVHETTVDYYLHLLAGVPSSHARRRLVLLSCHDDAPIPLTGKLLARPRMLSEVRRHIDDPASTHITCYTASALERTLAVQLGVPLYANDPALAHLGDKSHGREIMRRAGVPVPDGHEHLRDAGDMAGAIADLKTRDPDLARVVVKLNEGFSGEGNALFTFDETDRPGADLASRIRGGLDTRLDFEAAGESWESFEEKFAEMGGVVESFIEGDVKASPNARFRITPTGEVSVMSTQDQILGGRTGQVYLACRFPADDGYRTTIQEMGRRIAEVLRDDGVIGQVGPDFVCVWRGDTWECTGIEINIRMGGATHPFLMLEYLADGHYDEPSGTYCTPSGERRCYIASDNVRSDLFRGLTPDDLIDIAVSNDIHFHGASQAGVVFHLIGALSRYGKLGMVSIDATPEGARTRYDDAVAILEREAGR